MGDHISIKKKSKEENGISLSVILNQNHREVKEDNAITIQEK